MAKKKTSVLEDILCLLGIVCGGVLVIGLGIAIGESYGIATVIVWGVCVFIGGLIGERKGQLASGILWTIFLGPLGLLVLLALPNLVKEGQELDAKLQRHHEVEIQRQMLEELKALRAEKAQRENVTQPETKWVPCTPPPPLNHPPEDFIPESLRGVRRRK